MTLPDHAGLLLLAGCLVLAVGLVVAGFMRIVREGDALRRRIVAYADLPLKDDFTLASRRIELAEHRVATLPALLTRAERAKKEIGTAGDRVLTTSRALVDALRGYFRS
jgi:hypothetical protein